MIHPDLIQAYSEIGSALMQSKGNARTLQISLSFFKVEILEAYLEDLLDPTINTHWLSLTHKNQGLRNTLWGISFVLLAATLVVFSHEHPALASKTPFIFLSAAIVTGYLFSFSNSQGMLRRLKYAQLLNHEIKRRRGGGTKIPSDFFYQNVNQKIVGLYH